MDGGIEMRRFRITLDHEREGINMRRFRITLDHEREGIVKIHQACFDVVDDNWREYLYDLHTDDEIAAHIGYNLLNNRIKLSQMDGWADQPNEYAVVESWPDFDFEITEVFELKGA